jgi:hypothetical protein
MTINCCSIDLQINQNWAKIKSLTQKMINLHGPKYFSKRIGNGDFYDMGVLGSLIKHNNCNGWYKVTGSVIENNIPWLASFRKTLQEIKPDDIVISYMIGDGTEHIDQDYAPTSLIYIFDNSDPFAYTYVKDNDKIEKFNSIINTAWILDTQKLHGIINTGHRWALNVHFNKDYQTVKDWFQRNPGLVFGDKTNEH